MTPDSAPPPDLDLDVLLRDEARLAAAVSRAQEEAVRRRRLLGQPIVAWRDGQAVEVWPVELQPDLPSADPR